MDNYFNQTWSIDVTDNRLHILGSEIKIDGNASWPRAEFRQIPALGGHAWAHIRCPLLTDAVEKGLRTSPNSDSGESADHGFGGGDDGASGRAMEFILPISAR